MKSKTSGSSAGSGRVCSPNTEERIMEAARKIPLVHEADVVVCGGGPAGIAAAMTAAAAGARVVLLEAAGCLGGVWTAGLLSYVLDPKRESPVMARLVSALEGYGAMRENTLPDALKEKFGWAKQSFIYDAEVMKLVLEEQVSALGIHV